MRVKPNRRHILDRFGLPLSLAEYRGYSDGMTTHTEPLHVSDLVAENVRALMARTRTKQRALADALGMTQGAISKKLNGDRPFTLDEIEVIAQHFGVPLASLFEQSNVLPFRGLAGNDGARTITPEYVPTCALTQDDLELAS